MFEKEGDAKDEAPFKVQLEKAQWGKKQTNPHPEKGGEQNIRRGSGECDDLHRACGSSGAGG